jgi:N-acyl-D-amino-acid deacylase
MRTSFTFAAICAVAFAESGRAQDTDATRAAVVKSLALLEKSAAETTKHRKCFTCHHQAMPVLALTAAKERGFEVNEKEVARQVKWTADFLAKNREEYLKGKGQGGQADTAGYALWTLDAGGWKADDTTDAVIEYFLQRNKDRDHWLPVSNRPPTEASAFTTTYVVLRGLKQYKVAAKEKDIETRIEKSRKWLETTKPKDTEERVFQLRALDLLGAKGEIMQTSAAELIKQQRDDGGWSQIEKLDSDAYATGSVLATLHQSGRLAAKDDVYRRGVKFLLKTQKDDGSWHVVSRSKPFQTYFETGFPHGKDQFISAAASSWATIALTLTIESK